MNLIRNFVPALAAAATLAAIGAVPAAQAQTSPASSRLEIQHKTLEAEGGRKVEADAGRLLVPENRSAPGSRSIPIRFLRLQSTSKNPRAPLFYLAGGPGDRGVSESKGAVTFWARFLAVSDVVLVDQRGVGDPDLRWQWDGPPPVSYFVSADSALRHEAEMNRRAYAAIRARGVDLAGYDTVESATDLDELRAALGIDRISLFAFSYGTHLACAYLRRFDAHVDDVVMLGVEGPDQTYKLPATMDAHFLRIAQRAAQDPRIAGSIPDLVALYDRVIAKLADHPAMVPVPAPTGGDTLRLPIGPFGLRYILRADIGDATDIPVFPRLLWSIDHGDDSVLAWFVRKRAGGALGVSGMNQSMDVASGVSPARRALIESQSATSRFADVVNYPYPDAAGEWPVPDLGDDFRSPVTTSARVLLISGELDFNTPPAQSEEFLRGASRGIHLSIANAGHEQTFFQNDTALPVVLDFLAGKDVKNRKITYPALRFVPLEGKGGASHPSVEK